MIRFALIGLTASAFGVASASPGVESSCPASTPPSCLETFSVSQNGDGSNPTGISLATAWNVDDFNDDDNWTDTVGLAGEIGPGDCVTLRGSINGRLVPQRSGTAANPITFLGTGATIVRNEFVIDTSITGWTFEMLTPNGDAIYSKNISADLPTYGIVVRGFFENGGLSYNGRGDCSAGTFGNVLDGPGQWCRGPAGGPTDMIWYTPVGGSPGLVQSVTGSAIPIFDAQVPTHTESAFFLKTGIAHLHFRDLEITRANGAFATGSTPTQAGTGAGDIEISCITAHNLPTLAMSFTRSRDRIKVYNSIIRNATDGVYFSAGAGNLHEVKGNEIYNLALFSINGVGTNLDGHAVAARGIGDGTEAYGLLIEENELYNGESIVYVNAIVDGGLIRSKGIIVRYNSIHDALAGADGRVTDNAVCATFGGANLDEVTDILIAYNEFYNCGSDALPEEAPSGFGIVVQNVVDLNVHHNAIYNFRDAGFRSKAGGMKSVEFKNNIVSFDGEDSAGVELAQELVQLAGMDPDAYANLDFSNNLYEIRCNAPCTPQTVGRTFRCLIPDPNSSGFGTKAVNFDEWKDTSVCVVPVGELDSFIDDPMFISLPNGLDISPTSPAVDEALDLGYTRDIEGSPVPEPGGGTIPDVGAYEKVQNLPPGGSR
ncbi:MAG: hypothetical protein AAGA68_25180 [Pseudomonadota bacterium]